MNQEDMDLLQFNQLNVNSTMAEEFVENLSEERRRDWFRRFIELAALLKRIDARLEAEASRRIIREQVDKRDKKLISDVVSARESGTVQTPAKSQFTKLEKRLKLYGHSRWDGIPMDVLITTVKMLHTDLKDEDIKIAIEGLRKKRK